MRPPFDPDIELVCTGSFVHWGRERTLVAKVAQTPREVREIMKSNTEDMIELGHVNDREVPVYIAPYEIVAILPLWSRVEEQS